jgi:cytochrome c oxidase assembly protein subunit 15
MALFNDSATRKAGFALALAAFFLAFIVVGLGAFTRLVDAGLGCPDWPGCYGHLTWPDEHHEILRAEELFPHAPVEADKTWPEMVHRYFAGTLGILIAVIAVLSWKRREDADYPFRLPLLLLFLVIWQALFGMWTVTLKLWPQIVALHLLGGFATLSLLWVLVLRLGDIRWQVTPGTMARLRRLKPWVITGIVLVVAQVLLGGWTTANYAAFGCPDFPTCQGKWVPEMNMARGFDVFQTIGPNYLGGQLESDARVAIHFMHRVGALVVTVFALLLAGRMLVMPDHRVRRMGMIVLGILALQLALGITNVLMNIPLAIAVAHNLGGALLLLTLITLACRVWMAHAVERQK